VGDEVSVMNEHRQKLLAHPWRAAALWLLGSCAVPLLQRAFDTVPL
jgi:hypothetical protein